MLVTITDSAIALVGGDLDRHPTRGTSEQTIQPAEQGYKPDDRQSAEYSNGEHSPDSMECH